MGGIYSRTDSKYVWLWYKDNSGAVVHESSKETTKTAAREKLRSREGQVSDHRFPGLHVEKTSLDDLAIRILRDYRTNKKKSIKTLTLIVERLRKHFGHMKAVDIPANIPMFIDEWQARGLTNAYINRHLAALRRMWSLGYKKPRLVSEKLDIDMLEENNVRTGYYELDLYLRQKQVLPEYLQIALMISYISGVRKEECLSLERASVNFTTGFVQLSPLNTKTSEPRGFCLRGEHYEAILLWEQKTRETYPSCKYLIHREGARIKDFRAAWDTSLLKIGVAIKYKCRDCGEITERTREVLRDKLACEHCHGTRLRRDDQIFHDLRRTAVRNMIDGGVKEKDAMYISGHKTRAMLDRYKIVSMKNLEDAADKVYAHLKEQEELYRRKNVTKT